MLDQIGKALHANGFRFERIDGSKSDTQRRAALKNFRNKPDCCVLLASIGSAVVGQLSSPTAAQPLFSAPRCLTIQTDVVSRRLDLTVASRVHLMEPQWSPMAEEQALDRVHRMGQTRDVVATRYVVKESIEEVSILLFCVLSEVNEFWNST